MLSNQFLSTTATAIEQQYSRIRDEKKSGFLPLACTVISLAAITVIAVGVYKYQNINARTNSIIMMASGGATLLLIALAVGLVKKSPMGKKNEPNHTPTTSNTSTDEHTSTSSVAQFPPERLETDPAKDPLKQAFLTSFSNVQVLFSKQNAEPRDEQTQLLLTACEMFLTENPVGFEWTPTERGVADFFLRQLLLSQQDNPLTLPYFFHVTGKADREEGSTCKKIIKEGWMQTGGGVLKDGVYVSSYNEQGLLGHYTFAFTTAVYSHNAWYCQSWNNLIGGYPSLYAAIKVDISLLPGTLAYIVTPAHTCDMIRAELASNKMDVPVITKDVCDNINKLLEKAADRDFAKKRYHLPSTWEWASDHYDVPDGVLPDNVEKHPDHARYTEAWAGHHAHARNED